MARSFCTLFSIVLCALVRLFLIFRHFSDVSIFKSPFIYCAIQLESKFFAEESVLFDLLDMFAKYSFRRFTKKLLGRRFFNCGTFLFDQSYRSMSLRGKSIKLLFHLFDYYFRHSKGYCRSLDCRRSIAFFCEGKLRKKEATPTHQPNHEC